MSNQTRSIPVLLASVRVKRLDAGRDDGERASRGQQRRASRHRFGSRQSGAEAHLPLAVIDARVRQFAARSATICRIPRAPPRG